MYDMKALYEAESVENAVALRGRLRIFDKLRLEMRVVHEGRELVVEQVVVERPAGLLIEQQLLGQAVADAHGHTAVDLRLRQGGVDEAAAVVDVDDLVELHLAQGDIHL